MGVLRVVQATLRTSDAGQCASAWLRTLDALALAPATVMACYQLDATAQWLVPVAANGVPSQRLPPVDMSALDHPLVYAGTQVAPCWVDDTRALTATASEALMAAMKWPQALLALPLRERDGRVLGVLVLGDFPDRLRDLRRDEAWTVMLDIFQQHFARCVVAASQATVVDRAGDATGQKAARQCVEEGLIGVSVEARRLRAEILAAADSALAVLLSGETGVGKDHAAWLIHQASPRRSKAFVPLNCAAIAPELIAAELFGASKGAYTGADRDRTGLVAAADGGTLFLDEIGDMPLPLQATLLRVLNEKTYRPIGAVAEKASDFRLICATHQPLAQRVAEGRFREDLYFRIRQLSLLIPPLRERRTDIRPLAEHLIARHNRQQRGYVAGVSDAAIALLSAHEFRGNVRELVTVIQVACERVGSDGVIHADAVQALLTPERQHDDTAMPPGPDSAGDVADLAAACETFERNLIAERLRRHGGSRVLAAHSLGIPKRTLAYKCKKFQLDVDR